MSKNNDKMKHHALLSLSDEKPSNITAKRTSLNPGMIQDFVQDGDCDPREQTLHSPRLFLHDDAQGPRSWDNFFRKVVK